MTKRYAYKGSLSADAEAAIEAFLRRQALLSIHIFPPQASSSSQPIPQLYIAWSDSSAHQPQPTGIARAYQKFTAQTRKAGPLKLAKVDDVETGEELIYPREKVVYFRSARRPKQ